MTEKEYFSIHGWLRRNLVKIKCCSHCKTTTAKKYDWALRKGFTYTKNKDAFIELCRSCHLNYDYTEERADKVGRAHKKLNADSTNRKQHGVKLRKAVLQYSFDGNFIREWVSTVDVETTLGIDRASISSCCNGKRYYKSAGGFIWKYKH